MRFVILAVIAVFLSSGCSSQSDEQIKACLKEAEYALLQVESYSQFANMGGKEMIEKKVNFVQGNFYTDIKQMRDVMQDYLNDKGDADTTYLPFNFHKECGISHIESRYKSRIFELEKEEAFAAAEKVNSVIDAAQDAVIEEYRSKSVSHYSTKGAGSVKVDAFVMKNGKTVFCTTSIKDSGKAVDCHE